VQAEIVEDQQTQSSAPIGPQPPIPPGIHDIELSWDRRHGWMRIRIDEKSWWFKEYLGRCQVVGTSREGRIYIRASARINGETLRMWRDPDALPHPVVDGVARRKTQNRLCYRRAQCDFRINDDGTRGNGFGDRMPDINTTSPQARKLVYAQSIVGDLNCLWHQQDSIAHIYHVGSIIIDDDGGAHLYDPLICG